MSEEAMWSIMHYLYLVTPYLPDMMYVTITGTLVLGVLLSWKTVIRQPLDYDIYVVETQYHDEARRRVAQIVHLGYEERGVAGAELMTTLGAGRVFPRIEDISVVIQSPSTIVESNTSRDRPTASYINSMRMWMMEIIGDFQTRREGGNSGLAAAVAIAVANGRNEIHTSETRIRLVDYNEYEAELRREEEARLALRGEEGGEEQRVEGGEERAEEREEAGRTSPDLIDRLDEITPDAEQPSTSASFPEASLDLLSSFPPITENITENEERIEDDGGNGGEEIVGEAAQAEEPSVLSPLTAASGMEEAVRGEGVREAVAAGGDGESTIKIRLKFLDDTQTDLQAPLNISLTELKRRIVAALSMGDDVSLRLIYRGQLLRNGWNTLDQVGMEDNCVVHVLVGGRVEETGGGGGERRGEAPVNGAAERREGEGEAGGGGGEGAEGRRDDLEGRVAYHMDYIREVINMSALLLMGAADSLGTSWLRAARFIRDRVETRIDLARREGRQLGWMDNALIWVADWLGVMEGGAAPLPGIPSASLLLPFVLTVQIIIGWLFVALFPRFFDFSSVFFLFVITSTVGFFFRQTHTRINQPQ